MNRFYVYLHRRITDGKIFYIGKGSGYRARAKKNRNRHWQNIVNKHGYQVEIFKDNLTEREAFELEKYLIKSCRDLGIKICNLSDGGEGQSGVVHTEETKAKWRAAKLGKKQSPEHAKKSAMSRVGFKNSKAHIEATAAANRKQIINSGGEIFIGATEAARKLSERLGRYVSQGNISMCANGERNNAAGYSWSYDTSKTPELIPTKYNNKRILAVEINKEFESVQEAVKFIKKSRKTAFNQCISESARSGGKNKAYGYTWVYV